MNNIKWIRKQLFSVTQKEMAEIVGTTQTRLSRIENGEAEMRHSELSNLRTAAAKRFGGLWNDRLLFDPIESLTAR
jgi:predicted transcriptional regulator